MASALLLGTACTRNSGLPAVGSTQYRQLCAAFYLGLAALQSGEDVNARKGLTQATELAPGEPASWADLGMLDFRQQDYEGAFQSVARAQKLAPNSSRIETLLGAIESRRGKTQETLAHYERAVQLNARNLKALYALAEETERQNSPEADAKSQKLLETISTLEPRNIAIWVDLARLAAKQNNGEALRKAVANLNNAAGSWPEAARAQLNAVAKQATEVNVRPAALGVQFLRNVLVRVPAYRHSLDEVKTPATSGGEPFTTFLRLPSPSSLPSAPDMALRFATKPLAQIPNGARWLGTFVPDVSAPREAIWGDDRELHTSDGAALPLPAGTHAAAMTGDAILAADLNYDFKTDLVVATNTGLRIYQQLDRSHFTDVTAKTNLPSQVLGGNYLGAWAIDIDLDGDLDLVLGVPSGEPPVLRNNGDGTFALLKPFHGVNGLRGFASADIDGDGDGDVALLDGNGDLKVFANERLGDFRERALPPAIRGKTLALAAADVDGDGLPDFVALRANGHIARLSDRDHGNSFDTGELATLNPANGPETLLAADLDNNGGIDLVAGNQVFLSDGHRFQQLGATLPAPVRGFLELDGRLDPIGLTANNHALDFLNRATKAYHWQDVRPKAATTHGNQRMNSFGIGGQIEIRSDLLTEAQIIASPLLHFGLGEHDGAQFAKILWPNGLIQTEFALKANQTLVAEQRLKGSCPLLYAWNGKAMQFVKDVGPMAAALGAHDASGHFAQIGQSEQWFKISGDQLKARDGHYDVRVTDEYWESYFIDRYALEAVEHRAGTQIFVDERVAEPAAPLQIYLTGPSQRFASARDERGNDVSATVEKRDGQYLETFELGPYQGIAHDHWVELQLPANAPKDGPLYLVAEGWLHPWDDGILVAANQSRQKLKNLTIEVPDRDGDWHHISQDFGVPAGREKTIVLEVSKLFVPGAARKLRLRTNLEIYWDQLAWAAGIPGKAKITTLSLTRANLRHRGYSQVSQRDARSPEVPEYNQLSATSGKWQAIAGYYTRYGDIEPLLAKSDGRYVIAGTGDELQMQFDAGQPIPPGFQRDFVFIGDGWMKEGDYSFAHSTTLLPLPYQVMKSYSSLPAELEQQRAYRLHPQDWRIYHTRYVASESFAAELWKR